ncbi:hypothetical protein [Microbacterium sp. No. 7]|uniref:hypothetical protein n=1 Tax=Microbacterium sp. No. 7 TaxID=1714373 RepID=UPI0006CF27CC|nr:hypothetical protein [Microbacterium sp. No. 7]ALJ19553.1 hypothetical protein AOA12_06370 [Microbacterium sp. No. 7]
MNDAEYQVLRERVLAAKAFLAAEEDRVLDEADARGEAWTLTAWYYGSQCDWKFLTFEEALGRAQDDCYPVVIVAPDGTRYSPFTGEKKEES